MYSEGNVYLADLPTGNLHVNTHTCRKFCEINFPGPNPAAKICENKTHPKSSGYMYNTCRPNYFHVRLQSCTVQFYGRPFLKGFSPFTGSWGSNNLHGSLFTSSFSLSLTRGLNLLLHIWVEVESATHSHQPRNKPRLQVTSKPEPNLLFQLERTEGPLHHHCRPDQGQRADRPFHPPHLSIRKGWSIHNKTEARHADRHTSFSVHHPGHTEVVIVTLTPTNWIQQRACMIINSTNTYIIIFKIFYALETTTTTFWGSIQTLFIEMVTNVIPKYEKSYSTVYTR